jgi:hypothetical protein
MAVLLLDSCLTHPSVLGVWALCETEGYQCKTKGITVGAMEVPNWHYLEKLNLLKMNRVAIKNLRARIYLLKTVFHFTYSLQISGGAPGLQ